VSHVLVVGVSLVCLVYQFFSLALRVGSLTT